MGSESSSEAEEGGLEKAEAEEEEGFFQACFAPRKRTARRAPLRQLEPIAGGTAGDDNDDRGGRAPGNVDADADALAHKDAEVRSLKRELFKLKQKPSLRKLYMSNEGGSSGPESPDSPGPSEANLKPPAKATEAAEAVKQKDFEIENLKKDLCLSHLRAETVIRSARSALLSTRLVPSTTNLAAGMNGGGGRVDGSGSASCSEGGDDDREAEARRAQDRAQLQDPAARDSMQIVSALELQLSQGAISLDDYALALASLTTLPSPSAAPSSASSPTVT